jgi:hypothetical protein
MTISKYKALVLSSGLANISMLYHTIKIYCLDHHGDDNGCGQRKRKTIQPWPQCHVFDFTIGRLQPSMFFKLAKKSDTAHFPSKKPAK